MKRILQFLFSRLMITLYLIVAQIILFIVLIWKFMHYFIFAYIFFIILEIVVLIHLISKDDTPSFKLPWMVIVILFPIFGSVFYILFGHSYITQKTQQRSSKIFQDSLPYREQNQDLMYELYQKDVIAYRQAYYLGEKVKYPLYQNTKIEYLEIGEVYFQKLLEVLKRAKHFIFMEYFIVQEGKMWNAILEVLEQKVKEGVEVRFMYDDLGCIGILPNHYYRTLIDKGIKCVTFNPFIPVASIIHNNRDHRKITVVDGYMGLTGGVNLADEYINAYKKHGHWKDTGIYLEGEAVQSLTLLFLESWNKHKEEDKIYDNYMPHAYHKSSFPSDGYVIPYGDMPLDEELTGEIVYLNLINQAKDYIYINTPYFIVDYEFIMALTMAAKRGVDVRICTPHIPDKWYVHLVTQSHYKTLIESGVKVYEYTPGFLHAKSILVDDAYGVVGTINLDFRSLCHHYECAVWMFECKALQDLKADYVHTLSKCMSIKMEDCNKWKWYKRWMQNILRFFAPLM